MKWRLGRPRVFQDPVKLRATFSREEYEAIKALANEHQMTMSALMRNATLMYCKIRRKDAEQ